MADEPSNGELWRLISQMNTRLDRLVSAEVYAVEKNSITRDIADLTALVQQLATKQQQDMEKVQQQRKEDANRVTQTRRWLIASVIVPMLGLVLPVVLFLSGGKA